MRAVGLMVVDDSLQQAQPVAVMDANGSVCACALNHEPQCSEVSLERWPMRDPLSHPAMSEPTCIMPTLGLLQCAASSSTGCPAVRLRGVYAQMSVRLHAFTTGALMHGLAVIAFSLKHAQSASAQLHT